MLEVAIMQRFSALWRVLVADVAVCARLNAWLELMLWRHIINATAAFQASAMVRQ
jgi:hypothetical protein